MKGISVIRSGKANQTFIDWSFHILGTFSAPVQYQHQLGISHLQPVRLGAVSGLS